jgi:hypothetical protein
MWKQDRESRKLATADFLVLPFTSALQHSAALRET